MIVQKTTPDGKLVAPKVSSDRLRTLGLVLRTLLIGILLVLTVRISSPQNETIWSAYETPGDLIRVILGLAFGLWILVHLFMLPKDPEAYRTWVYLGLAAVPFALICLVAVW
jgi:archaellum biogenesis protein FlaJ (TadC family)